MAAVQAGGEGIADRLEAARAEVMRLERLMKAATCAEAGHRWRMIGGRNCGCFPDASCSVPVHECEACDYGDSAEANEAVAACRSEREGS